VNARKPNLDTALHLAGYQGHVDTVRALIQGGADVNAKKMVWCLRSVLWLLLAVCCCFLSLLVIVIVVVLLHVVGGCCSSPVSSILFRFVCPQNGDTALHVASVKGRLEVVDVLISGGADVHIRSNVRLCCAVMCCGLLQSLHVCVAVTVSSSLFLFGFVLFFARIKALHFMMQCVVTVESVPMKCVNA